MNIQLVANWPVVSSTAQWPAVRTMEYPARPASLTMEPEHCQLPPAMLKYTLPVRSRTGPPPVQDLPVTPPPPPGLARGVAWTPAGVRSRGLAEARRAGVQ